MTQKNDNDKLKKNIKPNSRIKKKKKKRKSIAKVTILAILITVLIGTGIIGGLVFASVRDVPTIDASNIEAEIEKSSVILDDEDGYLGNIDSEIKREPVSIDTMPDYLQKAFISVEDERFYDHFGIDIKGIGAAIVENIKAGSSVRGASTITQQFAKNYRYSNEKTYKRKIQEAYTAIQLEQQLTKDQILEHYLNYIYLGQGASGVKVAAFTYFSKDDLNDLTIAESALIAGITKNPSRLSP